MVPDGGTLLLGGQTVTTETEKETGVPVLSKIPIIGRAFSGQSKVKDQQILLLLVKPRIILMHETDQEALAEAEARQAHPF
jgi:type II secretory pathway component GspD/PulD (secretin)